MCPLPHATDGKQDRPYGAFALSAGWGGDPGLLTRLQPPLLVRSPRPPFCPFHSSCGKLPGAGTLNESPTNGPGVAGFGRGVTPRIQRRRDRAARAISKGREMEMKQKFRALAAA